MSNSNLRNFDKRMEKILRHHHKLSQGYVATITDDGLIVAKPQRRVRLPWRSILFLLVLGFGFKVGLHAYIGPEAYQARVDALAGGTGLEQIGAWAMTADTLTVAVSDHIKPLLD